MILDKIEVCGLIGRGGFGEVYLVYDRERESIYALKTICLEFLADAKRRELFKREALIWVSIEVHPFVLAADCVLQYPGGILVLMEYVPPDVMEKVSLADHLAGSTGPLDADRVLRLAIQSCYGMEHANRCGVNCHRDIKPSNILITDDDTPKITISAWRGQQILQAQARPVPS